MTIGEILKYKGHLQSSNIVTNGVKIQRVIETKWKLYALIFERNINSTSNTYQRIKVTFEILLFNFISIL